MLFDPYWNQVSTLLNFERSTPFADYQGNVWTPINGASLINDDSMFGKICLDLTGNVQTNTANNKSLELNLKPEFKFGLGDFTIECFINPDIVHQTFAYIVSYYWTLSNRRSWSIRLNSNNIFEAAFSYNGFTQLVCNGSISVNVGERSHVAVCRKNGFVKIFVNGVVSGSGIFDGFLFEPEIPIRIGGQADGGFAFSGVVDDIRITKGFARYDDNFTPPDESFPPFPAVVPVEVDGNIAADSFIATAYSVFNGDYLGSRIITAGTQDVPIQLALPCYVSISANMGDSWQPFSDVIVNQKVFPTNPSTTPYYFRCTIAGTTAATEPNWLTGTPGALTADGDAQWEMVERIPQPITHGPLIPQ